VHDAVVVGILESEQGGAQDRDEAREAEVGVFRGAERAQHVLEASLAHHAHRVVGTKFVVLSQLVDGHDGGVFEESGDARLEGEAFGHLLEIFEIVAQQLHRDVAAHVLIPRR